MIQCRSFNDGGDACEVSKYEERGADPCATPFLMAFLGWQFKKRLDVDLETTHLPSFLLLLRVVSPLEFC